MQLQRPTWESYSQYKIRNEIPKPPTMCRTVLIYLFNWTILCCYDNAIAQCGSERWEVKTLADGEVAQIKFTPKNSTVKDQLKFPKPDYHDDNLRDSSEKQVYKIKCKLLMYMQEDDSDWHLVVQDLTNNKKMVVEIPDPDCIDMTNPHFNKIDISRKRLKAAVGPVKKKARTPPPGTKLQVIGVGFFDKDNHPKGFKGRELHPVLELKVI